MSVEKMARGSLVPHLRETLDAERRSSSEDAQAAALGATGPLLPLALAVARLRARRDAMEER